MADIISNSAEGDLFCVGLSHRTTDLVLREKIYVRPAVLPTVLEQLRRHAGLSEAVILSTCNRFEVYSFNGPAAVSGWIASMAPEVSSDLTDKLQTWQKKDSVRHLFSVASGLEAQIIGETQILGQVKDAYETAKRLGMTGPMLNTLFQRALAVGKRVRTETKLAETPISVSSVSVRLCEKIFGNLSGRQVLVIGAGEISCLAAEHLYERGAKLTIFSTRSREHAEALAKTVAAPCYPLDGVRSHLAAADIVISGSGAPHILLSAQDIRQAQSQRKSRLLFLIDLAIPRDIDPAAAGMENVFLYNLDDLDGIAKEHRREREREIPRCEEIVQEETELFWDRLTGAVEENALHRFHSRISDVVEQELQRSGITGNALESLKKSIPNRILSEAFKRSRGEIDERDRQTFLKALKEFFGL